MRDSLGCQRFAHRELQACLLWVVSSECFEAGFAFRKAAIISLKLQNVTAVLFCRRGLAFHVLGTVVTKPWGYTDLNSLLVFSECLSKWCFLYVCLFSPKNSPKTNEARSKCQHGILAPVRPQDLSLFQREEACEGCGTCSGNAMGVLQQGDLHSLWQKRAAASKPKWEQKHPLFPVPFSSQSTANFSICRSKGDWKGPRQRVFKHRNPTFSSGSPWAEKGWGRPWGQHFHPSHHAQPSLLGSAGLWAGWTLHWQQVLQSAQHFAQDGDHHFCFGVRIGGFYIFILF